MSNKKSSGKPESKDSTTEISVAKIALISAITVAVIGMIGTAVNAYFSSQAAQAPIIIPIQATQTAEAARLIPSSQQQQFPLLQQQQLSSLPNLSRQQQWRPLKQRAAARCCPSSRCPDLRR